MDPAAPFPTHPRPRRCSPVLAVTLVALKASPHPDERYWPALMYSGQRWLPLAAGRTRHHAGPIGLPGHHLRDETGGPARVRDHVEQALAQLSGDRGVVVFTEQHRDLWPGLANPTLGDGLLPGLALAARGRDIAVVRVTHGSRTPRPTHRVGGSSKRPGDTDKAAMPEKILYISDHGGVSSWLFAAETRQHKGGQRTGTDYTRRTLPDASQSKLGTDFHAITRTEYTVARAGTWQEERLVGLAARLSQQSASWSGRTLAPATPSRTQRRREAPPVRYRW
ncbi:RNaseH domain-containing protein [Streptomyces chiangmaiensis]